LRLERDAAAGRLAAAANHDLRHLLGGVRAMLEWSRTADPASSEQALDHALRYLDQVADLLRDHADPRGAAGPRHCAPASVVADVERLSRHQRPRTVQWQTELPADLPPVACDAGACRSILLNLAVNAQTALAATGGRITVTAAVEADGTVALRLADDGPGIPAARHEAVFEAFQGQEGDGLGLGLWSARSLAQAAGGSLELADTPGGGATFTLRLRPVQDAWPAPAGRHLLLTEDDALMRSCLAEALVADGWRVRACADGEELLAALATPDGEPAVLVQDYRLPGIHGGELLAAVRAIAPTLPIVVMSGWTGGDIAAELARLQVASYLAKPFATADLLAACRRAAAGSPSHFPSGSCQAGSETID